MIRSGRNCRAASAIPAGVDRARQPRTEQARGARQQGAAPRNAARPDELLRRQHEDQHLGVRFGRHDAADLVGQHDAPPGGVDEFGRARRPGGQATRRRRAAAGPRRTRRASEAASSASIWPGNPGDKNRRDLACNPPTAQAGTSRTLLKAQEVRITRPIIAIGSAKSRGDPQIRADDWAPRPREPSVRMWRLGRMDPCLRRAADWGRAVPDRGYRALSRAYPVLCWKTFGLR